MLSHSDQLRRSNQARRFTNCIIRAISTAGAFGAGIYGFGLGSCSLRKYQQIAIKFNKGIWLIIVDLQ